MPQYNKVLETSKLYPDFFKYRNILDYIDMVIIADKHIKGSTDMYITPKFTWVLKKHAELPKDIIIALCQCDMGLNPLD
jgi:hypothetical protein